MELGPQFQSPGEEPEEERPAVEQRMATSLDPNSVYQQLDTPARGAMHKLRHDLAVGEQAAAEPTEEPEHVAEPAAEPVERPEPETWDQKVATDVAQGRSAQFRSWLVENPAPRRNSPGGAAMRDLADDVSRGQEVITAQDYRDIDQVIEKQGPSDMPHGTSVQRVADTDNGPDEEPTPHYVEMDWGDSMGRFVDRGRKAAAALQEAVDAHQQADGGFTPASPLVTAVRAGWGPSETAVHVPKATFRATIPDGATEDEKWALKKQYATHVTGMLASHKGLFPDGMTPGEFENVRTHLHLHEELPDWLHTRIVDSRSAGDSLGDQYRVVDRPPVPELSEDAMSSAPSRRNVWGPREVHQALTSPENIETVVVRPGGDAWEGNPPTGTTGTSKPSKSKVPPDKLPPVQEEPKGVISGHPMAVPDLSGVAIEDRYNDVPADVIEPLQSSYGQFGEYDPKAKKERMAAQEELQSGATAPLTTPPKGRSPVETDPADLPKYYPEGMVGALDPRRLLVGHHVPPANTTGKNVQTTAEGITFESVRQLRRLSPLRQSISAPSKLVTYEESPVMNSPSSDAEIEEWEKAREEGTAGELWGKSDRFVNIMGGRLRMINLRSTRHRQVLFKQATEQKRKHKRWINPATGMQDTPHKLFSEDEYFNRTLELDIPNSLPHEYQIFTPEEIAHRQWEIEGHDTLEGHVKAHLVDADKMGRGDVEWDYDLGMPVDKEGRPTPIKPPVSEDEYQTSAEEPRAMSVYGKVKEGHPLAGSLVGRQYDPNIDISTYLRSLAPAEREAVMAAAEPPKAEAKLVSPTQGNKPRFERHEQWLETLGPRQKPAFEKMGRMPARQAKGHEQHVTWLAALDEADRVAFHNDYTAWINSGRTRMPTPKVPSLEQQLANHDAWLQAIPKKISQTIAQTGSIPDDLFPSSSDDSVEAAAKKRRLMPSGMARHFRFLRDSNQARNAFHETYLDWVRSGKQIKDEDRKDFYARYIKRMDDATPEPEPKVSDYTSQSTEPIRLGGMSTAGMSAQELEHREKMFAYLDDLHSSPDRENRLASGILPGDVDLPDDVKWKLISVAAAHGMGSALDSTSTPQYTDPDTGVKHKFSSLEGALAHIHARFTRGREPVTVAQGALSDKELLDPTRQRTLADYPVRVAPHDSSPVVTYPTKNGQVITDDEEKPIRDIGGTGTLRDELAEASRNNKVAAARRVSRSEAIEMGKSLIRRADPSVLNAVTTARGYFENDTATQLAFIGKLYHLVHGAATGKAFKTGGTLNGADASHVSAVIQSMRDEVSEERENHKYLVDAWNEQKERAERRKNAGLSELRLPPHPGPFVPTHKFLYTSEHEQYKDRSDENVNDMLDFLASTGELILPGRPEDAAQDEVHYGLNEEEHNELQDLLNRRKDNAGQQDEQQFHESLTPDENTAWFSHKAKFAGWLTKYIDRNPSLKSAMGLKGLASPSRTSSVKAQEVGYDDYLDAIATHSASSATDYGETSSEETGELTVKDPSAAGLVADLEDMVNSSTDFPEELIVSDKSAGELAFNKREKKQEQDFERELEKEKINAAWVESQGKSASAPLDPDAIWADVSFPAGGRGAWEGSGTRLQNQSGYNATVAAWARRNRNRISALDAADAVLANRQLREVLEAGSATVGAIHDLENQYQVSRQTAVTDAASAPEIADKVAAVRAAQDKFYHLSELVGITKPKDDKGRTISVHAHPEVVAAKQEYEDAAKALGFENSTSWELAHGLAPTNQEGAVLWHGSVKAANRKVRRAAAAKRKKAEEELAKASSEDMFGE